MLREVVCEETNGEDLLHVRLTSQLKLNVPTLPATNIEPDINLDTKWLIIKLLTSVKIDPLLFA